jgi:hypothetical protein
VRHVVGHPRIPLVSKDRLAGQRLKSHRRYEMRRRLTHHYLHAGALLYQQAEQFCRLVGGDAASDAEDDAFSCEFHALCS